MRSICVIVCVFAALVSSAGAQSSFERRQGDLVALSGVFGRLHHLRRLCEPRREAQTWRDHMKSIIELEEPDGGTRARMVAAFNDAYREAQSEFSQCSRIVEDVAAAEAVRGEAIASGLSSVARAGR